MTPDTLQQATWTVARAGGVLAFLLVTASVVVGLVLSLKWRSPRYTRWVTTELHRFVTLLSLVFIVVHGLALAVDPYIRFSLDELFVPLASHYRPVWVALGITAGYLALAVYLSERIRGRIGYAWWHRFHLLAFVVWGASLLHGLGSGSDSQAPWALALYGGSALAVLGLLLLRLRPSPGPQPGRAGPAPRASSPLPLPSTPDDTTVVHAFAAPAPTPTAPARVGLAPAASVTPPAPRPPRRRSLRPLLVLPVVAVVVAGTVWAATGPLADGWQDRAGGTAAKAPDPSPSPSVAPTPSADPVTPIGLPFDADLEGTIEQLGGRQPAIVVKATFSGEADGTLEFRIPMGRGGDEVGEGHEEGEDDDEGGSRGGGGDALLTFTVEPTGATCTGRLEYADEGQSGGSCTMPSGRRLAVAMRVGLDRRGGLVGVMEVSSQA